MQVNRTQNGQLMTDERESSCDIKHDDEVMIQFYRNQNYTIGSYLTFAEIQN